MYNSCMFLPEGQLGTIRTRVQEMAHSERLLNKGDLPSMLSVTLESEDDDEKDMPLDFLLVRGKDGTLIYESMVSVEMGGIPGQVLRVPAPTG